MTDRELMQRALDALNSDNPDIQIRAALALRDRLAQPEPEPVAWFTDDHREDKSATTYSKRMAERWKEKGWPVTPLYTAPVHAVDMSQERVDETGKDRYDWNEIQCPCGHKMYAKYTKREWVGLTDEEVNQGYADTADEFQFYQVIEAKLREKNA